MSKRNEVRDAVAALIGRAPWALNVGIGSFLTMEFGKTAAGPDGRHPHGEWHLWLYMCAWRIQTASEVLVGSSDEREVMERVLKTLTLGTVTDVVVCDPGLDLCLTFESGHQIRTFSAASAEESQWILYAPDATAITVNSNGKYDYGPSNQPGVRLE